MENMENMETSYAKMAQLNHLLMRLQKNSICLNVIFKEPYGLNVILQIQ